MNQQLKKGILEIYVLAYLKRNDSYGYRIVQNLSQVIAISESTLYPIVHRLEEAKCLTTYKLENNGRLRKYYHVTAIGEKRLDTFYVDWVNIIEIYNKLINRANKK